MEQLGHMIKALYSKIQMMEIQLNGLINKMKGKIIKFKTNELDENFSIVKLLKTMGSHRLRFRRKLYYINWQ